jgi:hypothetical protein
MHILFTEEEFISFFQYSRGLQFEERPDYTYLKSLIKSMFEKYNFETDYNYDWNNISAEEEKEKEDKNNESNY